VKRIAFTLFVGIVALTVLLVATGCTLQAAPVVPMPPNGPGGCPEMCANEKALSCRWYAPSCIDDCEAVKVKLAPSGQTLNTGCVANARSCDEAFRCR